MEAKRILLGKQFLFFLVLLLILNGFFFLYQQTGMTGGHPLLRRRIQSAH